MRVGEMQQCMDAVSRAMSATDHAAKLSRSAAQAFEDQHATLANAKRLMENILANNIR